jgi:hypothetical protein
MTNSPDPAALAPGASRLGTLYCSFCRKDKDSVVKLVAGPGVYICNECVDLCTQIIGMDPAPQIHVWHERPDEELLASLAKVQAVVLQIDASMHDYVDILRARGVSWTRIGAALGVSKQAAWERFSGED